MKRLAPFTIFLGSFLSFGIQPLVGRTLLPAFGGMASVWVTCLAAFQVLLLAGYFYAHLLAGGDKDCTPAGRIRSGLRWHLALLTVATGWLLAVAIWHKPLAEWAGTVATPALGALAAVMMLVAAPYLLLSANASLVQSIAGGNYRLYAVSNAGSFIGLLAYPIVFELYLSVQAQWLLLAGLTATYACLLWGCIAFRVGEFRYGFPDAKHRKEECGPQPSMADSPRTTVDNRHGPLLWLVLPATGCFLLNAATAHLTSNVAPIPLMWVILLGLYLASYIVGFSTWGEKLLPIWLPLGYASALLAEWAIAVGHDSVIRFRWNVILVPFCLFACCTALHAWLCRIRPGAERLTLYNLHIAVGGAIGGTIAGVAAPLVFRWPLEYPVALVAAAGLCAAGACRGRRPLLCVGLVIVALTTALQREKQERLGILSEGRSFYGAWRVGRDTVTNQHGKQYEMYTFKHGGTTHGFEPVKEFYREGSGTAYYGPETAGMMFDLARGGKTNHAIHVGIVGLGIGTMACYGKPGDSIRFYEICPQVVDLTKNGPWFDFLKKSAADVEVSIGDARKSLENERAEEAAQYDLLVIDAYSGDSIPMHLITREAFDLYAGRVKPGGILALHISNWNIDLLPIVKAAAKHLGRNVTVTATQGGVFTLPATWAFICEKEPSFPEGTYRLNLDEVREAELPTDAKGSLLPFVNWRLD